MDKNTIKKEWARSVNDKENKPYKHPIYGNKISGKVSGVHYLIYNVLRGLPKERGFEPLGEGYKEATRHLESSIRFSRTDSLLEPFKNSVTADELRALL